MGLIRQSSLYQLEEIMKLMKSDIGDDATIKYHEFQSDLKYDDLWDAANALSDDGQRMGDLGCNGNYTNLNKDKNPKDANLISINNPLKSSNIDTLETFDVGIYFGDVWNSGGKKSQKFDQPDSELFKKNKKKEKKLNESSEYIQESLKYVKRFDEMDDSV